LIVFKVSIGKALVPQFSAFARVKFIELEQPIFTMTGGQMSKSIRLPKSTFMRCVQILSAKDRRKITLVVVLQILLGFLDLLGVAIIGLLGALSVSSIISSDTDNRLLLLLKIINLEEKSLQTQTLVLGLFAVSLLLTRTFLSMIITKYILLFFSNRGAIISTSLVSRLLNQSHLVLKKRTSQETLYAVTSGVDQLSMYVLGTAVVVISDLSLLLIIMTGLFFLNPITGLVLVVLFTFIAVLLFYLMQARAGELGTQRADLNIQGNSKILEALSTYRELLVRNRRNYYASEIGTGRLKLSKVTADSAFMPFVSKYVIETAIVIAAAVISIIQFALQDASNAVSSLAIFLAAGSRIAPSILRVQQGAIQIKSSLAQSIPTLDLIEEIGIDTTNQLEDEKVDFDHIEFEPSLQLQEVSFKYPEKSETVLKSISLNIKAGSFIALVGPSGGGKSTLIDLMLGVLNPDAGEITLSGLKPIDAISRWPGAISYVPQDVVIIDGSIKDNITAGYPKVDVLEERVFHALKVSNLSDFVTDLPLGLNSPVGERGQLLSGGQRQRLGIARAMYTNPKLLVLDEATSALDGMTESQVSDELIKLKGSVTLILIAHRLSTVEKADLVVYLANGRVVASGTFNEVKNQVPDFNEQASLMGL
jgi:ABC-type multidrug transport system fused ATPase/permease subunit